MESIKDYSYLEGKTITVNLDTGLEIGIITGIDRELGISIQEDGNLDNYLMCFNGPSSPVERAKYEEFSECKGLYYAMFDKIVYMLEMGHIDYEDFQKAGEIDYREAPSAKTCAFAQ